MVFVFDMLEKVIGLERESPASSLEMVEVGEIPFTNELVGVVIISSSTSVVGRVGRCVWGGGGGGGGGRDRGDGDGERGWGEERWGW